MFPSEIGYHLLPSVQLILAHFSSALNNLPPHTYLFSHISVMLSPGSPSKWQMQDSLSSTPSSLLYSESDQTEDESEVFTSESKAAGVVPDPKLCQIQSLANGSSLNSKSNLTFVNQRSGRVEIGKTGCFSPSPAYNSQNPTPYERIPTEGDLRFARKVSLKISLPCDIFMHSASLVFCISVSLRLHYVS